MWHYGLARAESCHTTICAVFSNSNSNETSNKTLFHDKKKYFLRQHIWTLGVRATYTPRRSTPNERTQLLHWISCIHSHIQSHSPRAPPWPSSPAFCGLDLAVSQSASLLAPSLSPAGAIHQQCPLHLQGLRGAVDYFSGTQPRDPLAAAYSVENLAVSCSENDFLNVLLQVAAWVWV